MITTMQASTLEYHRTCSLHNSLDCHVHPCKTDYCGLHHTQDTGLPQVSNGHTGGATR